MERIFKRLLSVAVVLFMVLGMVPAGAFDVFAEAAPELPTATVTEIEKEDLTFALNFKADEATQEQLDYYGTWMADYVLTINKTVTFNGNGGADGYLAGQYDAYSENWVYVPFEDVTLEANTPLRIMEYALSLMPNVDPGSYLTYNDVYGFVKDFNCGIFFEEEFLAANPDLEVNLELRMYNPENQDESYAIGETYAFTAITPALPTATVTEIENENLTFAMNFKADQITPAQMTYYGDWYADYVLTVNKDVSFNADGSADGWLSGQYDAWSENWVNVPLDKGNVELKAGEPLKIMEFASKLMGKPGLKYTCREVFDRVKDFDCGVFFDEEFLAANPDLEVTLELRIYNNQDETENYLIGETYAFYTGIPALPTATATKIENDRLTFAMNFKADQVSAAQLDYYGDWYADYVLTINKTATFNADGSADGWLSGQYDAWSENWVDVPFDKGNVELKAGESLKIMEFASKLMGKPGLKYTYKEVYEKVKDFDCGVFFTPEFLAANPDLEVTLELRMYNPADETESYIIGETYVFTQEKTDVAKNLETGVLYGTVTEALAAAAAGQTVQLLADVTGEKAEDRILILNEITLDLNGYTLEANYAIAVIGGARIKDSENGTGLLKVAKENLTLISNDQLPIWDAEAEGYHFVTVETYIYQSYKNASELKLLYWFLGALDGDMKHHLSKIEENDLQIILRVDYTDRNGNAAVLDIIVPDSVVLDYANTVDAPYFWVTIRGLNKLGNATITTYVTNGDVEIAGGSYPYTAVTE